MTRLLLVALSAAGWLLAAVIAWFARREYGSGYADGEAEAFDAWMVSR